MMYAIKDSGNLVLAAALAACTAETGANGTGRVSRWACREPVPPHGHLMVHPVVRADFGPFLRGQVGLFSSGWEYSIWYCPAAGGAAIDVRDQPDRPGLRYRITSVFSYSPHGDGPPRLVILFEVSRAIPGMEDARGYGGEVYGIADGRAYELERESEALTGLRTAAEARAVLQRSR